MTKANVLRKTLIFWCLFIGVGAVFGFLMMIIRPDGSLLGMYEMLPYFQALPFSEYLFQSFLFAGIALLLINGIPNFISACLLIKKHRFSYFMGMTCGIILMLWIIIQFVIFPLNFMSVLYFIFGALQAGNGLVLMLLKKKQS